MSIIIETENPGARGVRKAVKAYRKRYPDFSGPIEMYGKIMEIQQEALESASCALYLDSEEIERMLREGTTLIKPWKIEIDPEMFLGVVKKICAAVNEKKEEGFPYCDKLMSWEGLNAINIPRTRDKVLGGEELELSFTCPGDEDLKIISNILWEALAPSYRKCGSILQDKIDHAIWQRGYCPVCGCSPLMGKFREQDGLWLLECSLCHTLWNVQRARCPFCEEGTEGSLEYLYLDDDRRSRIQYCDSCHHYVKTVDLRDSGQDVLLPLEDIVTMRLDQAARQEGLKPAEGFLHESR